MEWLLSFFLWLPSGQVSGESRVYRGRMDGGTSFPWESALFD